MSTKETTAGRKRDGNEAETKGQWISGAELCPADQGYVKCAYVHRFTGEHTPQWARKLRPDGTAYEVQFANDQDWLAHTRFAVRGNGRLDGRVTRCESNPTWPNRKGVAV